MRLRRAQERELCRRGRHGEFRAAGLFTVSTRAAKLCATSDVSSQKSWTLGGGQIFFAFVSIFNNANTLAIIIQFGLIHH